MSQERPARRDGRQWDQAKMSPWLLQSQTWKLSRKTSILSVGWCGRNPAPACACSATSNGPATPRSLALLTPNEVNPSLPGVLGMNEERSPESSGVVRSPDLPLLARPGSPHPGGRPRSVSLPCARGPGSQWALEGANPGPPKAWPTCLPHQTKPPSPTHGRSTIMETMTGFRRGQEKYSERYTSQMCVV